MADVHDNNKLAGILWLMFMIIKIMFHNQD